MNREELIRELEKRGIRFTKVRFYKESPYQKRRYKSKYVGWEAWIYNDTIPHGYLITQEDYENNPMIFEGLEKVRGE